MSRHSQPRAHAAPPTIEFIARGLLIERGHVLLCRSVKSGYRYLPGGHVEFGERAADALAREFMEEAGLPVHVRDLVLTMENAFRQAARKGKKAAGEARHEVALVFHVERAGRKSRAGPPPVLSLEPKIAFDWWPIRDLAGAQFLPPAMLDGLRLHAAERDRPHWLSAAEWLGD